MSQQISPLPEDAVLRLSSSEVIHDSASVVKELIDNALDAGADNVKIIISANTLDSIQVTDNGRGISSQDRALVGQRHHTSKIRSLTDLEGLGGSSLGFRGEALASIAEMSGKDLSVTTRTADSAVAAKLLINRQGVIVNEHNIGHPVGTTTRVGDLLATMPVRQKKAQQQTAQTYAKIKILIRSYFLARLSVRFQLVWSKQADRKHDIVYAPPSKECSLRGAVLAIFGTSHMSRCFVARWPLLSPHGSDKFSQGVEVEIEAVLERPGGDQNPVISAEQYISIDGRPLASDRGTGKKICQLYRKHSTHKHSPFLCMLVRCPPNVYDINIEPSKDDVRLDDSSRVLETVEDFLSSVLSENCRRNDIEDTQASVSHDAESTSCSEDEHKDSSELVPRLPPLFNEEPRELSVDPDFTSSVTNPWTIAKLTGSFPEDKLLIGSSAAMRLPLLQRSPENAPLPTPDWSPERYSRASSLAEAPFTGNMEFPDVSTLLSRPLRRRQDNNKTNTLDKWLAPAPSSYNTPVSDPSRSSWQKPSKSYPKGRKPLRRRDRKLQRRLAQPSNATDVQEHDNRSSVAESPPRQGRPYNAPIEQPPTQNQRGDQELFSDFAVPTTQVDRPSPTESGLDDLSIAHEDDQDFEDAFSLEFGGNFLTIPECLGLEMDVQVSEAEIQDWARVIGSLSSEYVGEVHQSQAFVDVSDDTLENWEGAIKGMMQNLDPNQDWESFINIRDAIASVMSLQ